MTRLFNKKHIVVALVAMMFLLVMGVAASTSIPGESEAIQISPPDEVLEVSVSEDNEVPVTVEQVDEEATPAASDRWNDYLNVCESFSVVEGDQLVRNTKGQLVYPVRHRRNRYVRTRADRRSTRDLIRLVAKEMGADKAGQDLIDMIAYHESTWNPEAIHILNGDLDANQKAWNRHSYSPTRERALQQKLKHADARSKDFWKIKAALADIRLYKHNEYWGAQLEYTYKIPERTMGGEKYPSSEWKDHRSVWAFGYGLYGMNAVLYTHVIGQDAPPWVLCSDEGIVATIAAVWALREQQETCAYLSQKDPATYGSDGASLRGIVRRWGTGMCGKNRPGPAWRRVFADVSRDSPSLTWETVPDLGDKFPSYVMFKKGGKWRYKKNEHGRRIKTDPIAVIAHMRAKAEEAGYLRPTPLKRKHPGTEPVIVARR
jgi:hypothetical protein